MTQRGRRSATITSRPTFTSTHVISPSHVLRPGAGGSAGFTSQVPEKGPCDQVGNELSERPEGGKYLQARRILVRPHRGSTLQKYGLRPRGTGANQARIPGRWPNRRASCRRLQHSRAHQRHRRRQRWAIPRRRDRRQRRYRGYS